MPTYSAIQLDRFLEPGASKTTSSTKFQKIPDVLTSPKLHRSNTASSSTEDLKTSSRSQDIPPPHPRLSRRNSTSSSAAARAQIHPALYATPEPTPLPDSPTSFSFTSPYVINHKRRGPRLSKSFSDQNVAVAAVVDGAHTRSLSEETVVIERQGEPLDEKLAVNGSKDEVLVAEVVAEEGRGNGDLSMRENGDSEDFYDPQDSMSFSGTADSEDFGGERSAKANTPMGEFYDAWEELSSDSGAQAQRSLCDVEIELREMRLSFLMEIEKRKQAEEVLQRMQQQWKMLREKLGAVGLILPADLTALAVDSQADASPTEEICRQIQMARFVSESIGRGIAKAEAEADMEAQLEMKNFEIARLADRLHYYETVNREMSQRNQEAIENARHERQKRRRRQKWVWGSIAAAAVTLGSAALLRSYLSSGNGSSSNEHHEASQHDVQ